MARLPTMSALERADLCPGSEALEHAGSVNKRSRRGVVVHDFLKNVNAVGREEALKRAPGEFYEVLAAIDIAKLPIAEPGAYAAEVALALDVVTGEARELGRDIDRDYEAAGLRESEVAGTPDLAGLTADAVVVIDWKGPWASVADPSENWQLRIYAATLAKLHKRRRAHVTIIRIGEDSSPRVAPWHTYEAPDLDAALEDLRGVVRRVVQAREDVAARRLPILAEGEHCRYCPARRFCPVKSQWIRDMAGAPIQVGERVRAMITTPEEAGKAWRAMKRMQDILDDLHEGLKAFAEQTPIPIGNGREIGPVTIEKDVIDGAIALRIVREMFGEEVAAAFVLKATKTALEAAMKVQKARSGEPVAKLMRTVLTEISGEGGLTKREEIQIRERAAQSDQPALPAASAH